MKASDKATFRIETLGCKLNQYDSAVIEGELIKRELSPSSSLRDASVVIINTCTVTKKADYQSRQLIRKIRRENPSCTIVVTGCYARLAPETLRALPEANIIIDASDHETPAAIARELKRSGFAIDSIHPNVVDRFEVHYTGRTRAFLKIQDGCDLKCSYCIVPRVRGTSRSLEPETVIRNIRNLLGKGYREIVLTGINSGNYGRDLHPRTTLLELLNKIISIENLGRVRLNSLEPPTISDELIELVASTDKIAHHLHVPLQSGCDKILAMMNRPYRKEMYLRVVNKLRQVIPDIGIGTDVIVGFPGETDADFEDTFSFMKDSPINFLHVFPFSRRPDTPASKMPGEVNGKVMKDRSSRLRRLGEELGFSFRKKFHGTILDCIILEEKRADGLYRSLSGNYIEIGVRAVEKQINRILPIMVTHVSSDDTRGEIVPPR